MNFKELLQQGKKGELIVYEIMKPTNPTLQFVENAETQRQNDIDLTVNGLTLEVKYDAMTHSTRNMFIELIQNIPYGTKGWFYVSKADYLFYIEEKSRTIHAFKLNDLREYYYEHNFDNLARNFYNSKTGAPQLAVLMNIDSFVSWLQKNGKYYRNRQYSKEFYEEVMKKYCI